MNEQLKKAIADAFKEFKDFDSQIKSQKCQMLMRAIPKTESNKHLLKELEEKGLPVRIFVNEKMDPTVVSHLSYFGPVHRHWALNEDKIMFSWVDSWNFDKTTSELFPNETPTPGTFNNA